MAISKEHLSKAFWFTLVVLGQAGQNVSLPLALSSGEVSMTVFLVYCSFIYYLVFSLLDVLLDFVCSYRGIDHRERHTAVNDVQLSTVGMLGAFNGMGAVFGGSPTRTPLTLQMAIMMVSNLCAARFKIWSFNLKNLPLLGTSSFHKHFYAAVFCYGTAFVFIMIDRVAIAKTSTGSHLNFFCLFFVVGAVFGMASNVRQDRVMAELKPQNLSALAHFKQAVSLLRRQLAWMFITLWLGCILAMIPGADQSGVLNRAGFEGTWARFLPFGDLYVNIFNFSYIVSFIASVFLNKIDSSLSGTAGNMSSVIGIAAGWLPTVGPMVVGYSPNVPLTAIAIVMAFIGMYPSEMFSRVLRAETAKYFKQRFVELEVAEAILSGQRQETIRSNLSMLNDVAAPLLAGEHLNSKKCAAGYSTVDSDDGEEPTVKTV